MFQDFPEQRGPRLTKVKNVIFFVALSSVTYSLNIYLSLAI